MNFLCRVLKPPGGGSSLIFGGEPDDVPQHKVKTHNASQLPLGEVEDDRKTLDHADGSSTPSQSSTSNGSPNNSEPNTPRSGEDFSF